MKLEMPDNVTSLSSCHFRTTLESRVKLLISMIDSFFDIGQLRIFLASFLFVVCHAMSVVGCPVNENRDEMIVSQAEELVRLADEVQNEIKTHLRSVRGQAKMRGLNSQVRGRTAAVIRRIKRNPDYDALPKDLEKLVVLTRKLNISFEELRFRPDQNRKFPGMGVTGRVSDRLARMSELAGSTRALSVNDFPPLAEPSRTIPEYDPAVDIAPGFVPDNAPTINSAIAPDGQIIVPAPEPQQPRMHSVLEK
jgi:hypothetical protein